MRGIMYIFFTSTKNLIKKSLKKPVTYIWIVAGLAYLAMVVNGFSTIIKSMGIGTPKGFVVVLSFAVFFFLPANMVTYARKKGLIFRASDIHFVFSSPMNPKFVLLYAHLKTIIISFLVNLLMVIMGVLYFHVGLGAMLLFFILSFLVETIVESSIMVLLFGNETLTKSQNKIFSFIISAIVGALLLFGVYLFFKEKASFDIVSLFLNHPFLQCIPIIGWNIAFIRLLLLGPTTLNVIGTVLYCLSAIILFQLASKMKCSGEYYEDAMTFADTYEERRKRNKKGVLELPGKRKFHKATITYKGSYAKAIFYRQLLEYKKSRFFIFGLYTVVNTLAGIGIAVFAYYNYEHIKEFNVFIIPAVIAYITFIFSGMLPKWMKELDNPYTYLLPDTAMKKLWYSTKIEHIRAFTDGCLITIPAACFLRLTVFQALLTILIYVCIQACKLYLNIVCEAYLGKVLGIVGKQFFKLFLNGIIITIAVFGGVIGGILGGVELAFVLMIAVVTGLTLVLALIGAQSFERMESLE